VQPSGSGRRGRFTRPLKLTSPDRADALRPSSLRVAKLYLTGPYFRPLHALGIADITQADVAVCLTTVARQHSAQTAAAARRSVSALFRRSIEEGWNHDESGDRHPPAGTAPIARSRPLQSGIGRRAPRL
jgi:hypothetical protein